MSRVTIEIQNKVAIATMNRPDKINALDYDQFMALIAAGKELNENPEVRAVVLRGSGKGFCSGLDIKAMTSSDSLMKMPLIPRSHGLANSWQQAVWTWNELQVPVIAAVHGVAFGGGLQIMLAADIKYIEPSTKLSILEMKWGIIPDMAGTQLMKSNVRLDIIKELTYTHRVFSGTEAVDYGFATHLSDNPFDDALSLAHEIASKSPSAIVHAKKLLNAAEYLNPQEGLLLESKLQDAILFKHNQLEAVMSQMQKREANFKDYRLEDS